SAAIESSHVARVPSLASDQVVCSRLSLKGRRHAQHAKTVVFISAALDPPAPDTEGRFFLPDGQLPVGQLAPDQLHPHPPPALPSAPRAPSRASNTWCMYEPETGCGSSDMIGSASAWRSYGFTQGSMLPQAESARTAVMANRILVVSLDAPPPRPPPANGGGDAAALPPPAAPSPPAHPFPPFTSRRAGSATRSHLPASSPRPAWRGRAW